MVNSMLVEYARWGAPLIAILAAAVGYLCHVASFTGASGNVRSYLVLVTGGVSRYPPLDADPAPPAGV